MPHLVGQEETISASTKRNDADNPTEPPNQAVTHSLEVFDAVHCDEDAEPPVSNTESTANDEVPVAKPEDADRISEPEPEDTIIVSGSEEEEEEDAERQWSFVAIRAHRADPEDPTLVQLYIEWAPSDSASIVLTWEPEVTIQEDCPHAHRQYFARIDRAAVTSNKWHAHHITQHRRQGATGKVQLKVYWVGSDGFTWEAESRLRNINPDLLKQYWESRGGRRHALA